MANIPSWLLYKHPGPFLDSWKARLKFILVVTALVLATDWLGHNYVVQPPAKWYNDFQLRRREKAQERVTRIVQIDGKDHQEIFHGKSPLPGPAVVQAACTLAGKGAAVVVVDLDTSSPEMFPDGFKLPETAVPIVWAVDTTWQPDSDVGRHLVQHADRVLGGRLAVQPAYGIATMPADFDGLVRFFQHAEFVDGYPRPTLPAAAVHEFCNTPHAGCPQGWSHQRAPSHSHPPAFTRDVHFEVIRLSKYLHDVPTEFPTSCPQLGPDPSLRGRIVVLGGSYSRADSHDTAWGTRQGAELVAMAIEQLFDPAPMHELAEYASIGLEILLALLIAAIHHWIRPLPATLLTLVLLPMAIVVSSELVFQFGDYDVFVVPFIVGMLIHQLVGSAERAEHLAHQLELSLGNSHPPLATK